MYMMHFIIEAFCSEEPGGKGNSCYEKGTWDFNLCFECPNFSCGISSNELAYSNEDGIVETMEDWIGFGGNMLPDNMDRYDEFKEIWKEICRKKITEAYDEYMKFLKLQKDVAPPKE